MQHDQFQCLLCMYLFPENIVPKIGIHRMKFENFIGKHEPTCEIQLMAFDVTEPLKAIMD